MKVLFGLLIFMAMSYPALAVTPVVISRYSPFQGETVTIRFLDKDFAITSAIFDNKAVPFFSFRGNALVVIPIAATKTPGTYIAKATLSNGEIFTQSFKVRGKRFNKVALGAPKESTIKQEELAGKVQEKNVDLDAIFREKTPQILFNERFGLPLYNNRNISTVFGTIYKTGSGEIRHMGVDFAARIGTPIGAINSGIVKKAYLDSVYGNSVILDHGLGIYSYYIHMNEIKVREGDPVKKGDVLGTVGQTGYATAPHLHLSLKIGGVAVDPLSFVSVLW